MSFFGNNPATNTGGIFGSGTNSIFGVPKPAFGNAPTTPFGTPQATGFGSTTNPFFGTVQPTGFGSAANTSFGQSPFGAQPNTAFGTGLTFGNSTSQPNLFSHFGAKTTAAPFSFNTNPTATNIGFGTPNTGFGFGQSTQPRFNSNVFGTSQPLQSNAFSGFGAKTATQGFTFNAPVQQVQPQQQQQQPLQQQPQINESQAFYQSLYQCFKFGDERDEVLAHLNYVQACMGKGKGYYSQVFPPVTYTSMNPYCRFKAISYSYIFTDTNEDGQVILTINKNPDKVQAGETQIIHTFQTIFNRPNIMFNLSEIKRSGMDESTVILVAEDKSTNRRVPAYDLTAALAQPFLKAQLENLGILQVFPKVKPSPEQLRLYLQNPPCGIDPRVWLKAQHDNPKPLSLIPVPILGIEGLKKKIDWQDSQNQEHQSSIKRIEEDIAEITSRYMSINIEQLKRRHYTIVHRLLKVILRIDAAKMSGVQLYPVEQELKKYLERMDTELNKPSNCKGHIRDLLAQLRRQKLNLTKTGRSQPKLVVEKDSEIQIKSFLSIQQKSAKHLVEATEIDMKNLNHLRIGIEELQRIITKP